MWMVQTGNQPATAVVLLVQTLWGREANCKPHHMSSKLDCYGQQSLMTHIKAAGSWLIYVGWGRGGLSKAGNCYPLYASWLQVKPSPFHLSGSYMYNLYRGHIFNITADYLYKNAAGFSLHGWVDKSVVASRPHSPYQYLHVGIK